MTWLALSAGFSGLLSQLICTRELLAAFSGNELVVALTLGIWLLSSGLGSLAGSRFFKKGEWIDVLLSTSCILPIVSVLVAKSAPAWFIAGLTLDPARMVGVASAVLAPSAFLWGALFASLASMGEREGPRVYAWESAGAVLGGVIFLLLQSFSVPSFAGLAPAAVVLGISGSIHGLRSRRPLRSASGTTNGTVMGSSRRRALTGFVVAAAVISVVASGLLEYLQRGSRADVSGREVIEEVSSPYGRLVVSGSIEGERVLNLDGVPVADTADAVGGEEPAHYAMAQAPIAAKVLLIGGGATGAAEEILKHGPQSFTVVEINPEMVRLARERLGRLRDPRIQVRAGDPRRLVEEWGEEGRRFDVVILGLGDPSTLALSRLYTVEFLRMVRRLLTDDGVLCLSLSRSENYSGAAGSRLHASVFRAVRSVFPETLILPGQRTFILGSARPLTEDIASILEAREVATRFVRKEYLSGMFTEDRLRQARLQVEGRAETNRDSRPAALRYSLDFWLAQFRGGLFGILGAGLALAALAIFISVRSPTPGVAVCVAATGWAAMSLEMVLLFAFQTMAGSLYRDLGLLLAVFMAGLAMGTGWARRRAVRPESLELGWLFLVGATAGLLALPAEWSRSGTLTFVLFGANLGAAGWLAGAQYAAAVRGSPDGGRQAARLYAVDLLGASSAALLTGIWLVPALGQLGTLAVVGAMKVASYAFLRLAPATPAWARRAPWAWVGGLAVLIGLAVWMISPNHYVSLYSISMRREYGWLVGAFLILGLAASLGVRPQFVWTRTWRGLQFVVFSLVAFMPILRCWFRVPYVFCHACPRPCAFGAVRPYVVWSGALMNVTAYPWCHHACPIGLLLHAQPGVRTGWVKEARRIRWWVFGFVVAAYFAGRWGVDEIGGWGEIYHFFLRNEYAAGMGVLGVAAGLLLLNLRLRRSFCNLLCPVGALMDATRSRVGKSAHLSSEPGSVK